MRTPCSCCHCVPHPRTLLTILHTHGDWQGNLAEARALAADVPLTSRPLLLPALHTSLWLDRLAASGHDVFDPSLQGSPVSPLGYQLRLKWAMLRHQY